MQQLLPCGQMIKIKKKENNTAESGNVLSQEMFLQTHGKHILY